MDCDLVPCPRSRRVFGYLEAQTNVFPAFPSHPTQKLISRTTDELPPHQTTRLKCCREESKLGLSGAFYSLVTFRIQGAVVRVNDWNLQGK